MPGVDIRIVADRTKLARNADGEEEL
jgi:hypothetical protein